MLLDKSDFVMPEKSAYLKLKKWENKEELYIYFFIYPH